MLATGIEGKMLVRRTSGLNLIDFSSRFPSWKETGRSIQNYFKVNGNNLLVGDSGLADINANGLMATKIKFYWNPKVIRTDKDQNDIFYGASRSGLQYFNSITKFKFSLEEFDKGYQLLNGPSQFDSVLQGETELIFFGGFGKKTILDKNSFEFLKTENSPLFRTDITEKAVPSTIIEKNEYLKIFFTDSLVPMDSETMMPATTLN